MPPPGQGLIGAGSASEYYGESVSARGGMRPKPEDYQIVFPKLDRPSSMLDMDDYSPRAADHPQPNEEEEKPDAMVNPASPPDYGLEMPQMVPRLVKWLMHRRVTKIASGGVHNICVVEPSP